MCSVVGSPRPLAGRGEELMRLRAAVTTAVSGSPVLVTLGGDPGIGKTALLAELSRMAAEAGMSVATGRAFERERSVPFASVTDPLEALIGAAELSALTDWATRSPTARHRSLRAIRTAVCRAVRRRGTAFLLDDLHWADDATLDLLHYVLSHPPPGPLLLAVACRPRQDGGRLAALAARTGLAVHRVHVELGPLSAAEIREMLAGGPVPPGLVDAAGGNPLYAQVLAAGGPGPFAGPFAGPFPGLPSSVSTVDGMAVELPGALVAELGALEPGQLRALRAAAVLGDPFEPGLVSTVLAGDTAAALDALVARDLLRPADAAGGRLRFRHPVLAAAVYRAAPPAWRLEVHERAAAALAGRGDPVALAPHLCRTAQPGDTAAVRVLCEAAARAAPMAPGSAAEWLAEAGRLAGPGAPPDQRIDLVLAQARARLSAGQVSACRDLLVGLLDWLPTRHPRWLDAVALTGLTERILGTPDATYALLGSQTARLDGGSAGSSVAVIADHVAAGALLRRSADSTALAVRAVRAARAAEPPVRAAVHATAAMAAACYGSTAMAKEWMRIAAATVDGQRDNALLGPLNPIGQLAWAEAVLGQDTLALRHFGRALDVARRFGQEHLRTHLLLGQGYVLRRRGALADAVRAVEAAGEAALRYEASTLLPLALAIQASATLWLGRPAEALRYAEQAVQAGGEPEENWYASLARRVQAWITLQAGDPRTAQAMLLAAAGGPELPRTEVFCRAYWLHVLVEAELATGDDAAAAATALLAGEAAEAADLPGERGHALLAAARVQADPGLAGDQAGQAARLFAEAGHPLEEAQARLVAAAAARRAGAWDTAEWCLSRVRAIARACDARWLRDSALTAQRGLSGLAGRTSGRAIAGLTRREAAIVELLVAGLSNAEIAGRLHLTVKTIEAHLTRIYRKLGVRSRSAAAALLSGSAPEP